MFYGNCQVCGATVKLPSSHVGMILKGRGKGCHCSRRSTDTNSEYKWNYSNYGRNARLRGLTYLITLQEFMSLVKSNCAYCGLEPEMRPSHHKRWDFKFPMSGIDRKDPKRGYESDNVVPCCSFCNQAKWDHSEQDFLNWVNRVSAYQNKNKEEDLVFQEVISA